MATKNGLVPKEVHLANAGFNKLPANWSVVEVGDMMSGKLPIIKLLVQTTRKNWLNHVQNQAGR